MKPSEKEAVMHAFAEREFDLLVATVVIEVGIDIPNATVMAIENAERFGLSQLHQLRGRIGRGSHRSYCLLFPGSAGADAQERLEVVASTADGFRIAEEDLRLRGPGEFFGTRQHGLPELTISDLGRDYDILRLAHKDAFETVKTDPALARGRHPVISKRVRNKFKGRLDLIRVG
jgi:ATP-dependent DNA helicase RecG